MDVTSLEQALAFKNQEKIRCPRDKRPAAKDLSHHLSQLARHRRPSPLKELFKYIHPGILSFAGGIRTWFYFMLMTRNTESKVFPTGKIQCRCSRFCHFHWTKHTQASSILVSANSRQTSNMTVPKYPADIPINLSVLLQYGMVTGLPALSTNYVTPG